MSRIAVIGGGAWGTALAMVAGRRGDHQVRLWALEKEVVASISKSRVNDGFLPGCPLPESVSATGDFREALEGAEIGITLTTISAPSSASLKSPVALTDSGRGHPGRKPSFTLDLLIEATTSFSSAHSRT